ncbi:glycoside hydrolase [Cristinia sonorae]|uniref:glucan endo-1,3-beta-D-glucosidase n=1 Tax=Cristinia sonorae TaxID=1940300 RepID=A0A8K0XQT1_9AGAR|nr:glycoside hydrolase [Cristinia sonorae]
MEGGTRYLEKQEAARTTRKKWIVIGSIIGLVAIIAVGVGVGVAVAKNNSNKDSSGKSSSGSHSGKGPVEQSDPNDPSTFVRDANLKHSFYGIAYTPEGSQLPDCGNNLEDVIKDIQLMSQLTSRIRLYGADCNQTALVLDAIQRTKVDMQVYLGIYNIPTDPTPYTRQRDLIKEAIETYGVDHVAGITVGNEFMLNYLNANGGTEPNTPIGDAGAALLIPNITDTRNMLAGMSLPKTIPVGTSDAGSYFNNLVMESIDYGMANVHPWFANVSIDQAADWTETFFQENNVVVANALPNKPQMFIAETGWPTKSSDAGNANNGPSLASVPNLQTFLDTFTCQANQKGTGYFFFSYFDEPWKDKQFGGVEGWWGLFNADRTLKDITIPDCHID